MIRHYCTVQFFIFLLLLDCIQTLPSNCDWECGIPNSINNNFTRRTLIVNGRETSPNEYPFMVSLSFNRYYKNGTLIRNHQTGFCGGSIISEQFILTAAHCFANDRPKYRHGDHILEIIAKVAEHNLFEKSDQDRAYTIINILIHPGYDPIKNDNDIALLKINGTFPCNNNNVKPVCLGYLNTSSVTGFDAWILGWGHTSHNGNASPILKEISVKMNENDNCVHFSKYEESQITENMICGDIIDFSEDSCQRDSGGPVFVDSNSRINHHKYVQIGIVSFGEGCGEFLYPGVYTRVPNYKTWIDDIMTNNDGNHVIYVDLSNNQISKTFMNSAFKENTMMIVVCSIFGGICVICIISYVYCWLLLKLY